MTIDASNLKSGAKYSGSHATFNNEYGKAYAFSMAIVDLPTDKMPKDEYLKKFKKSIKASKNGDFRETELYALADLSK